MLNPQDNDPLTRVGPGTPMGNLMRRYWMPAPLSFELPEPDCPPLECGCWAKTSSPSATPTAASACSTPCPHRRASLFFGRNEEDGLRCVYHGWKFDVERRLRRHALRARRQRVQRQGPVTAYPAVERGGVVWAYMGPPDKRPADPLYRVDAGAGDAPRSHQGHAGVELAAGPRGRHR